MTFGEKIKFLRTRKNITQVELAKAIGVSLRTLINYETYNKMPQKKDIYKRLADTLNTDVSFLTNDSASVFDGSFSFTSTDKINVLLAEFTQIFSDKNISKNEKERLVFSVNNLYWKTFKS